MQSVHANREEWGGAPKSHADSGDRITALSLSHDGPSFNIHLIRASFFSQSQHSAQLEAFSKH
jgi:hypothetical protein